MTRIHVGFGVCWAFRTECGHCKRDLDIRSRLMQLSTGTWTCCHHWASVETKPLWHGHKIHFAIRHSAPRIWGCQQWCSNSQAEKTTVSLRSARERNMFLIFLASCLTKGSLIPNCLDCNGCKSGSIWKQAASLWSGMQSFSFLLHPNGSQDLSENRPKTCRVCLSSNSMVLTWLWASHWRESSSKHITIGIRWAGVNAVDVEAKHQSRENSIWCCLFKSIDFGALYQTLSSLCRKKYNFARRIINNQGSSFSRSSLA